MYIRCTINSYGQKHLTVSESYTIKVNGIRRNRKRTIQNIGPLKNFDDGQPNFVKRLQQSFKEGNPIIAELKDLANKAICNSKVLIEFDRSDKVACMGIPKNIGYFFLDGLYDSLGIYDVLNLYKSRSNIAYDLNGLAKLLIFGRILTPDSKIATHLQNDKYLLTVTKTNELEQIYRTLDVLNQKSETFQNKMNKQIAKNIGRNAEICYYDVTNYWFEIPQDDKDATDESGNIKKGLRKKGVSKEKRSDPIVQMGLFIDTNGIPIAYRLFPGNEPDQTSLRPAMKKTIDVMNFGKVIIIADGGLNSGANLAHIINRGNGYIVSKSPKVHDKDVKSWILEEDGYSWNAEKTFKVKSKIRMRIEKDEDGNEVRFKEKIVSYWSQKHYKKQIHENAEFLKYLDEVDAKPHIIKRNPRKTDKFLKESLINKKTGVELKHVGKKLSINLVKGESYFRLLGYYTLLTSEIDKTDNEVIDKYHGLSRIEDSFRIIKSDLSGRPVYVRTEEHINAHFLICFIALTMLRIIQHKILNSLGGDKKDDGHWKEGMTAKRIKNALNEFTARGLPGGHFFVDEISDDLKTILSAFNIESSFILPTMHELHKLKLTIDKATGVGL